MQTTDTTAIRSLFDLPAGVIMRGSDLRTVTLHRTNSVAYWTDVHGDLHHPDMHAEEWSDGIRVWYRHGNKHRADGPAVITPNGDTEWWLGGRLHRDGGAPAVERSTGLRQWWVNGCLIRSAGLHGVEQLRPQMV